MMQWAETTLTETEANRIGLRRGQHYKLRQGLVVLSEAGKRAYDENTRHDAPGRAEAPGEAKTRAEAETPAAGPTAQGRTWKEEELGDALTLPADLLEEAREGILLAGGRGVGHGQRGWEYTLEGVEMVVRSLFPDMAEQVMHDFVNRREQTPPEQIWFVVLKRYGNTKLVEAAVMGPAGAGERVTLRVQDNRRLAIGGILKGVHGEGALCYAVGRQPSGPDQHMKITRRLLEQWSVAGRPAQNTDAGKEVKSDV